MLLCARGADYILIYTHIDEEDDEGEVRAGIAQHRRPPDKLYCGSESDDEIFVIRIHVYTYRNRL